MRKRLIWPVVAALGLTLGLTTPSAATAAPSPATPSAQTQQILDELPAMRAKAEAVKAKLGVKDNPVQDAVLDAIDPTQYECSDATPPVVAAVMPDVTNWTTEQRLAVVHVLLFNMALMDAAYLPQTGPFTFGSHGQYTRTVTRTFKDLQKFWDIPSRGIQLVPAHGRVMLDAEVNYRVFTTLYGFDPAQSRVSADLVAHELNSPALGYGDLPIFTFNAFAAPGGEDIPGYGKSPKRIAYGDGVMEGFSLVGLGSVAPQAILAHEFGHHVQFADSLMRPDLTAPEASRWAELMADSFSAYFLTHARGEGMHWKSVREFGQMFYQLGDCGFDAAGHHGTPNQRMKAALWGYGVAVTIPPRGHILPSRVVFHLFAAHYPRLIAPDAPA
ncbi:hypothetical protein AB0L70_08945 [Kribbella sp. NPDC051952]|uniref:hypothetical protein n=1 Tax=Kribbella sp. NPDC051952 TaxID=3154851 RepID=UPI003432AC6A